MRNAYRSIQTASQSSERKSHRSGICKSRKLLDAFHRTILWNARCLLAFPIRRFHLQIQRLPRMREHAALQGQQAVQDGSERHTGHHPEVSPIEPLPVKRTVKNIGSIPFGVGDGNGFHQQHHFFKKQFYFYCLYHAREFSYVWKSEVSSRFLPEKRDLA